MSDSEEHKIATGFDRGVDYLDMKSKLIADYNKINVDISLLDEADKWYDSKKKRLFNKAIYALISMIQLSNGSRISEACLAFKLFLIKGTTDKVVVKLAKSKTRKTDKNTGEEYYTKTRYRKIQFPTSWITMKHTTDLTKYLEQMNYVKNCIINYLQRNYGCNTHSLRYAFINYMLYNQKKEMAVVAKFVGHSNMDQLVRYTQNKETDKLFDIDI
jgi:integrase